MNTRKPPERAMHPIDKAILDERMSALRGHREADEKAILAGFNEGEVEQWRKENERKDAARDEEEQRRTAERVGRRIQAQLAGCHIPPKFSGASFDTLHPVHNPKAFKACQRLAEEGRYDGRMGLILTGAPGNGKTSLAIASLRRFVERTEGEDPASFWNVNHSLQTIRQSFDEDRRQEGSSILDVCRASFIVLDDFDKVGRVTAWVEEQFYALINGLYVEERRVIVTTNLSARRLLEMLDDSLASRLMEMCTEVAMAPHDYRAAS